MFTGTFFIFFTCDNNNNNIMFMCVSCENVTIKCKNGRYRFPQLWPTWCLLCEGSSSSRYGLYVRFTYYGGVYREREREKSFGVVLVWCSYSCTIIYLALRSGKIPRPVKVERRKFKCYILLYSFMACQSVSYHLESVIINVFHLQIRYYEKGGPNKTSPKGKKN